MFRHQPRFTLLKGISERWQPVGMGEVIGGLEMGPRIDVHCLAAKQSYLFKRDNYSRPVSELKSGLSKEGVRSNGVHTEFAKSLIGKYSQNTGNHFWLTPLVLHFPKWPDTGVQCLGKVSKHVGVNHPSLKSLTDSSCEECGGSFLLPKHVKAWALLPCPIYMTLPHSHSTYEAAYGFGFLLKCSILLFP